MAGDQVLATTLVRFGQTRAGGGEGGGEEEKRDGRRRDEKRVKGRAGDKDFKHCALTTCYRPSLAAPKRDQVGPRRAQISQLHSHGRPTL